MMKIGRIAIHLAGDAGDRQLTGTAAALATRLGAKLTGVFPIHRSEMPDGVVGRAASAAFLQEFDEARHERARLARAAFEKHCRDASIDAEWDAREGEPSAVLSEASLVHDLLIISGCGPEAAGRHASASKVVSSSACPTLILPSDTKQIAGRRILIGWKPSRPTTHAIRGAADLIKAAEEILLLAIDGDSEGFASVEQARRWLAAQGIEADVRSLASNDRPVSEILRESARENECDLMVIGAFGRSRLKEMVLGGVTADLLADPPLPLLVAN